MSLNMELIPAKERVRITKSECAKIVEALYIFMGQNFISEKFNFKKSKDEDASAVSALNAVIETKQRDILERLEAERRNNKVIVNIGEESKIYIIEEIIERGYLPRETADFLKNLAPEIIDAIYYGFEMKDKKNKEKSVKPVNKQNSKINDFTLPKTDCAILTEIILRAMQPSDKVFNIVPDTIKNNMFFEDVGSIKSKIECIKKDNKKEEQEITNKILWTVSEIILEDFKREDNVAILIELIEDYNLKIRKQMQIYQKELTPKGCSWLKEFMRSIEESSARKLLNLLREEQQTRGLSHKREVEYMKTAKHAVRVLCSFNHLTVKTTKLLNIHAKAFAKFISSVAENLNNSNFSRKWVAEESLNQIFGSGEKALEDLYYLYRHLQNSIFNNIFSKKLNVGLMQNLKPFLSKSISVPFVSRHHMTMKPSSVAVCINGTYYYINFKTKHLYAFDGHRRKITEQEYRIVKEVLLNNLEDETKKVFQALIPQLDKVMKKKYLQPICDKSLKKFVVDVGDRYYYINTLTNQLRTFIHGSTGYKVSQEMTRDEFNKAKQIFLKELDRQKKKALIRAIPELNEIMKNKS